MRPSAPCAPPLSVAAGVSFERRGFCRVAGAALLLALATAWSAPGAAAGGGPPAGEATQVLFTDVPAAAWPGVLDSEEPEPDFSIDVLEFPRAAGRTLVPNDRPGDLARAARLRRLGKALFTLVACASEGPLAEGYRSGTLAALEVAWGPAGGVPPPPADRLPAVGRVYAPDEEGIPRLVARLYAYDAGQFERRLLDLRASGLLSPQAQVVWSGSTVTAARVLGPPAGVYGPISRSQDPANGPPPLLDLELAACLAVLAGTYHEGDVTFDPGNPPPCGLVFAEGDIRLLGDDLEGSWTLVSAGGDVEVRGDRLRLSAHAAGLLAFAAEGHVTVAASHGRIQGELLAPRGTLTIGGEGTLVHGLVTAETLVLEGEGLVLSDGTHPRAPDEAR